MRLIDADEVKKKLCYIYEHEKDVINSIWRLNTLVDKVDEIPTAYDLDKMLKQLKEVAIEKNDYVGMGGEKVVNLDDAIEIVKTACSSDFKEKTNDDWISVHERFPDTNEYILLSFENTEDIEIGKYKVDKDGNGVFYIGDEYQTCLSQDLFVNAWKPLPQPHKGE